jgi:hypothetical protein
MIRTNLTWHLSDGAGGSGADGAQRHGKVITVSSVHGLGGTHYCSLYRPPRQGSSISPATRIRPSEYNIR